MTTKDYNIKLANYFLLASFFIGILLIIAGYVFKLNILTTLGLLIIVLVFLAFCVGVRYREQNKNKKIHPYKFKPKNTILEVI